VKDVFEFLKILGKRQKPLDFLKKWGFFLSSGVVSTRSEVVLTRSEVVLTRTGVVSTRSGVVSTRSEVVLTRSEVVLTPKAWKAVFE